MFILTNEYQKKVNEVKNVSDIIQDALIDDIYNGKYTPGESITQEGIAEKFGVSRFPVRDAIQKIIEQGLLKKKPRGGVIVNVFSKTYIENLYDTRKILEIASVKMVIKKISKEYIIKLKKINEEYKKALMKDDIKKAGELNDSFHESMINKKDLNNDFLYELIQIVRRRIKHPRGIARLQKFYLSQRKKYSFLRHQEYIKYLSDGNEQGLVKAVSDVIEDAKKETIIALDSNNWLR